MLSSPPRLFRSVFLLLSKTKDLLNVFIFLVDLLPIRQSPTRSIGVEKGRSFLLLETR